MSSGTGQEGHYQGNTSILFSQQAWPAVFGRDLLSYLVTNEYESQPPVKACPDLSALRCNTQAVW